MAGHPEQEWRDDIVKETLDVVLAVEEQPYLLMNAEAEASVRIHVVGIVPLNAPATLKHRRLCRRRDLAKVNLNKKALERSPIPGELEHSLDDSAVAVRADQQAGMSAYRLPHVVNIVRPSFQRHMDVTRATAAGAAGC